jgi:ABC-type glycerol-3-phosphate transport system substrate-binding protein
MIRWKKTGLTTQNRNKTIIPVFSPYYQLYIFVFDPYGGEMKKTPFTLGLVIALLALLAACQPQVVTETVEVEVTRVVTETETVIEEVEVIKEVEVEKIVEVEKEVEVEKVVEVNPVVFNSYSSDPAPRAFEEKMIAAYTAANPNSPVQHTIVNHEDFKQAIRAYLVAEPAPDVLTWFAGNRARFFIDKELILPISDVWEDEGWNEDFPKGFRAMSEVDGEAYFLPTSWYWWAIFYRTDIFEEYNITPPETWDEMLAVCDTLDGAGLIPITIGTKFRWTAAAWFDYINMRLNGPQFHLDLMLGKESYTDPRVKAVFEKWGELFEHNCFIDNAAAYSWQEAVDPLNQGDAAMYLMGQFIMDPIADDVEDKIDFFRFPIIDPAMPIGEDAPTDGFFIAASAANPEGAKDLLAYMGSLEAQTLMVEEMGRLPTHNGVDKALFTPFQQKGIDLINEADMVVQFFDRDTTPEMADVGMNGMMAFWDDPTQIDAILEELEAARLEIFGE